jgi:hypothetical protein
MDVQFDSNAIEDYDKYCDKMERLKIEVVLTWIQEVRFDLAELIEFHFRSLG